MKQTSTSPIRLPLLVLALALFVPACRPANACTIFVLTDGHRTLFCNNEDWSNPVTRIWFVPAGEGYRGCVYVGFDDGWAQGGMNAGGLAFDWVAGANEVWRPDPAMVLTRGNPSQRMLETCATVDEAIRFYRTHWEPGFATGRILVADRTGASLIIGARAGRLHVERSDRCRGFGYGQAAVDRALATPTEPTVPNGAAILRQALQRGKYATKYSNVFDLRTGDIVMFRFADGNDTGVRLNLAVELARGGHFYDIPRLREQLPNEPRPLLTNMRRFPLDEFKPIPDREPEVTAHVRAMIGDAASGAPRPADYTPDLWKEASDGRQQVASDLKRLGDLRAVTLVERSEDQARRVYRYRLDFTKASVINRFEFTADGKLAYAASECIELKPEALRPDGK